MNGKVVKQARCADLFIATRPYGEAKSAVWPDLVEAVLFGSDSTPEEIQQLIIERAQALKLPVAIENIQVNRQGGRTWADATYSQSIEVFPNQHYPVNWSFRVEGYTMVLGAPKPRPVRN